MLTLDLRRRIMGARAGDGCDGARILREEKTLIRLTLFGAPSIHVLRHGSWEPCPPGTKRLAVLACTAVAQGGTGVRRDSLVGLLWPESSQERARGALRQLLATARQELGDGIFAPSSGDSVALDARVVRCDVWTFRDRIAAGDVGGALELYRGSFLDGFYLDGSAEWDDWVERHRARLRDEACEAAWRDARTLSAAGEARTAITRARFAVACCPFDERSVRQLLRMLACSGDRAAVATEYRAFAARLKREFDLDPDPRTEALVRRSLAGETEPGDLAFSSPFA